MLRISANILFRTLNLLIAINDFSFVDSKDLLDTISNRTDTNDLFEFSCKCNWASLENEKPKLTERGINIVSLNRNIYYDVQLKMMLKDYITTFKPIWANRIPYGRKEATIFMTKDEVACFNEAGLLDDNPSLASVDWWDEVSASMRNEINDKKNQTGRDGEKLTIQYENHRVKRSPVWQSIDSNLSGYDVISYTKELSDEKLLIEVKTTKGEVDDMFFYISKNEWNISLNSDNYLYYLWSLSEDKIKLAKIKPEEMLPHIPTNNLNGEWETVKIPFSSFEEKFVEIKMEELR